MDKKFHATLNNDCSYFSMLVLKLNHVSKKSHWALSENKNRLFMLGDFRDEDKTAVRPYSDKTILLLRRGYGFRRQKTRGYQHDNSNNDHQAISLFALAGALIYCCSSATFCGGDTSCDQITRVLCRTNNPHIANNIFMGGNIVMHTDVGMKI